MATAPDALNAAFDHAWPLGDELIDERLTNLPPNRAQLAPFVQGAAEGSTSPAMSVTTA